MILIRGEKAQHSTPMRCRPVSPRFFTGTYFATIDDIKVGFCRVLRLIGYWAIMMMKRVSAGHSLQQYLILFAPHIWHFFCFLDRYKNDVTLSRLGLHYKSSGCLCLGLDRTRRRALKSPRRCRCGRRLTATDTLPRFCATIRYSAAGLLL
jgi:hypothetical protein